MALDGKYALVTGSSRGYHRERHQPGMDRGQRHEHIARAGPTTDSGLAQPRVDTDGTLLGTPADIGDVVALPCSEKARWITGQVIYADGGASLMNPEVPPEIQVG